MPNIVITSTADYVKVVFNDESSNSGLDIGYWSRADIVEVLRYPSASNVEVRMIDHAGMSHWVVDLTGSAGMAIDTIDGATPANLDDLAAKIAALMKS